MLRRWISVCLIFIFIEAILGAQGPPLSCLTDGGCAFSGNPPAGTRSRTRTSRGTSTTTELVASPGTQRTTSPGIPTATPGTSRNNGGNGGASTTSNAASTGSPVGGASADAQSTSSGMTSGEKIGVGVGVGVGAAAVFGVAALWFIVRRRKRNAYGPSTPTVQYQNQPAMASGAPALAGAAAMGRSRSPSTFSQPRPRSTASQEPVYAPSAATSQQSVPRTPPRLSLPPPSPEEEYLMPGPSGYMPDEAPSPMEEDTSAVSPVSPISPADSRPPSPLRDNER